MLLILDFLKRSVIKFPDCFQVVTLTRHPFVDVKLLQVMLSSSTELNSVQSKYNQTSMYVQTDRHTDRQIETKNPTLGI